MSTPLYLISCTKCDLSRNLTSADKIYQYHLPDGGPLHAIYSPGHCFQCKTITPILLGLSAERLKKKAEKMEKTISFLTQVENKTTKLEFMIRDLIYELMQTNKYITLLDGKNSKNYCLTCGSLQVVPFKEFRIPDCREEVDTCYTHLFCGGNLRIEETGIRIRYNYKKIHVDPEF